MPEKLFQPSPVMHGEYSIRVANEDDISAIRRLVNLAYQELAEHGWNYTATYQDEDETRRRLERDITFVIESHGEIIGTVAFPADIHATFRKTGYISQLGIHPRLKRQGLGNLLMDLCEKYAMENGYEGIQLDTAKSAEHLVNWYLKRGYQIVGEAQWEGKSYPSWIFKKSFKEIPCEIPENL